jgi:hypothetical protein
MTTKNNMKTYIERVKESGVLFPTIFDFPDMWRLNSKHCDGKFNLYFFWLYPILFVAQIPFTILCCIETALTKQK